MNIEQLNTEINQYIDEYPDNGPVLKRIKDKINSINKQMSEEYSLVFMAEKGAGKTTTIDFLLGLTFEKQKINDKTKKKYIVEEDVLETGSGATTTSEVEICQSDDAVSKIIVVPYEVEDIIDILKSFATIIFANVYNFSNSEEQLAPELLRACRNMSGLTEKKNEEIGKVDQAIELAKLYSIDNYNEFENEIIRRAKLEQRKVTEFIYNNDGLERAWIKKVFRRLNLVHLEEAPLPKKIIVKLNKSIFDFNKLNRINKIVDTRGLEVGSNTDRMDIRNVFRNEENNILLFVDKFNSPSKSIIDLLDHYIYDSDMEIADRVGYVVNYRDGEANKVVGCDGVIENAEEGISEKRNQVIQIFKDNEVNVKSENIVYCNPKKNLDQEGKIEISVDELEEYDYDKVAITEIKKASREEERLLFVDNIIGFIDDYDEQLENELAQLIEKYEDVKAEIETNAKLDVSPVIEYLENNKIDINLNEKAGEIYDEYIENKFPSTLRAINNRFGIYNSYDIFCEGANVIENLIKGRLKGLKDDVLNQLDNLARNKRLNKNQEKTKEFLVNDINKFFFSYIEVSNTFFYEKLKESVFGAENNEFWDEVRSRWGKGAGYRKDIVKFYKNNIERKEFGVTITEDVSNLIDKFKKEIINILNDLDVE